MKGVVLAGGLGTRLYPLTHVTNKHLLPVFDKPMIYYPINTLVRAGITEILIVVGGPHAGHFTSLLKNGKEWRISHLEYAYQEKEGGIAQALALAEDFADKENITVILGDNTTDADISSDVKSFQAGAKVFLKEVSDPARYGIANIDTNNKLIAIEEKPKKPIGNLAAIGLYIYDSNVFSYIRQCKPSGRNELEITDVNNIYIKKGDMKYAMFDGYWNDAGTFESLYLANKYWAGKNGVK